MWRLSQMRKATLSQHIALASMTLEGMLQKQATTTPQSQASSSASAVAAKYFENSAVGTLNDKCPSAAKLFTWAVAQRETDSALALRRPLIIAALQEDLATLKSSKNIVDADNSSPPTSRAAAMWADLFRGAIWSNTEASSVHYYATHPHKRDELNLTGGILGRSQREVRSDGKALLELIELYQSLREVEGGRYDTVLEGPLALTGRVVEAMRYLEATVSPRILRKIVRSLIQLTSDPAPHPAVVVALVTLVNSCAETKSEMHFAVTVEGRNTTNDIHSAISRHVAKASADFANPILQAQKITKERRLVGAPASDEATAITAPDSAGLQVAAASNATSSETASHSVLDDYQAAYRYRSSQHGTTTPRATPTDQKSSGTVEPSKIRLPVTQMATEALELILINLDLLRALWNIDMTTGKPAAAAAETSENDSGALLDGESESTVFSNLPSAQQAAIATLTSATKASVFLGRASYYGFASRLGPANGDRLASLANPESDVVVRRFCRLVAAVGKDLVGNAELLSELAQKKLDNAQKTIAGASTSEALAVEVEEFATSLHLARTVTATALCHCSTPTAVNAVVNELIAHLGDTEAPALGQRPTYQAVADDTVADFIGLAKDWSVIHEPSVAASIIALQLALLAVAGDFTLTNRPKMAGDPAISTYVSPVIRQDPIGMNKDRQFLLIDRALMLVRTVAENRPRVSNDQLSSEYKQAFQEAHGAAVGLLITIGAANEAYLLLVTHKHHGLSVTKGVMRPLLYVLADQGDCRALNLVDLTTLYCNNRVDIDCIAALFRMCEAASDHHRARALLMVMRDVIPGFLSKVPPLVIQCLRSLQVLPKRDGHLFMTPNELTAPDVGTVPDIAGGQQKASA